MFNLATTCLICLIALFDSLKANECNVMGFGAAGDGSILDDEAFSKAMEACTGGKVVVPAGSYLLSPFNMTSNTDLYLEAGAILLATTDFDRWPIVEALPSYQDGNRIAPFIGGIGIANSSIRGTGTIDGQGSAWWNAASLPFGRGRLIEPMYCTNFTVSGVTLTNSPFWTLHPFACDGVLVENVVITAPVNSPNTDGVDPGDYNHQFGLPHVRSPSHSPFYTFLYSQL